MFILILGCGSETLRDRWSHKASKWEKESFDLLFYDSKPGESCYIKPCKLSDLRHVPFTGTAVWMNDNSQNYQWTIFWSNKAPADSSPFLARETDTSIMPSMAGVINTVYNVMKGLCITEEKDVSTLGKLIQMNVMEELTTLCFCVRGVHVCFNDIWNYEDWIIYWEVHSENWIALSFRSLIIDGKMRNFLTPFLGLVGFLTI